MGAYSPEPQDVTIRHSESNLDLETGSECSDGNDLTTITAHSTDTDDSSTDIDAVVQEYKERLKVSNNMPFCSSSPVPHMKDFCDLNLIPRVQIMKHDFKLFIFKYLLGGTYKVSHIYFVTPRPWHDPIINGLCRFIS